MAAPTVSLPRRLLRLARLVAHFVHGQRIVRKRFPRLDTAGRDGEIRRWSRQLLDILDVEVRAYGAVPALARRMVVANHLSWLDIFVIYSHAPGVFVAKSEIRDWPLLGALVAEVGTLFIVRGRRTHARHTNDLIAATLTAGRTVAVFPEGTTGEGEALGHFHAALLQPAIDAQAAILPVGLRYRTADGERAEAAHYVGEMSFARSLWRVVSQRKLVAELHITAPLATAESNRRALARAAEAAIARALDLPLPHRHTEKRGDLPV